MNLSVTHAWKKVISKNVIFLGLTIFHYLIHYRTTLRSIFYQTKKQSQMGCGGKKSSPKRK